MQQGRQEEPNKPSGPGRHVKQRSVTYRYFREVECDDSQPPPSVEEEEKMNVSQRSAAQSHTWPILTSEHRHLTSTIFFHDQNTTLQKMVDRNEELLDLNQNLIQEMNLIKCNNSHLKEELADMRTCVDGLKEQLQRLSPERMMGLSLQMSAPTATLTPTMYTPPAVNIPILCHAATNTSKAVSHSATNTSPCNTHAATNTPPCTYRATIDTSRVNRDDATLAEGVTGSSVRSHQGTALLKGCLKSSSEEVITETSSCCGAGYSDERVKQQTRFAPSSARHQPETFVTQADDCQAKVQSRDEADICTASKEPGGVSEGSKKRDVCVVSTQGSIYVPHHETADIRNMSTDVTDVADTVSLRYETKGRTLSPSRSPKNQPRDILHIDTQYQSPSGRSCENVGSIEQSVRVSHGSTSSSGEIRNVTNDKVTEADDRMYRTQIPEHSTLKGECEHLSFPIKQPTRNTANTRPSPAKLPTQTGNVRSGRTKNECTWTSSPSFMTSPPLSSHSYVPPSCLPTVGPYTPLFETGRQDEKAGQDKKSSSSRDFAEGYADPTYMSRFPAGMQGRRHNQESPRGAGCRVTKSVEHPDLLLEEEVVYHSDSSTDVHGLLRVRCRGTRAFVTFFPAGKSGPCFDNELSEVNLLPVSSPCSAMWSILPVGQEQAASTYTVTFCTFAAAKKFRCLVLWQLMQEEERRRSRTLHEQMTVSGVHSLRVPDYRRDLSSAVWPSDKTLKGLPECFPGRRNHHSGEQTRLVGLDVTEQARTSALGPRAQSSSVLAPIPEFPVPKTVRFRSKSYPQLEDSASGYPDLPDGRDGRGNIESGTEKSEQARLRKATTAKPTAATDDTVSFDAGKQRDRTLPCTGFSNKIISDARKENEGSVIATSQVRRSCSAEDTVQLRISLTENGGPSGSDQHKTRRMSNGPLTVKELQAIDNNIVASKLTSNPQNTFTCHDRKTTYLKASSTEFDKPSERSGGRPLEHSHGGQMECSAQSPCASREENKQQQQQQDVDKILFVSICRLAHLSPPSGNKDIVRIRRLHNGVLRIVRLDDPGAFKVVVHADMRVCATHYITWDMELRPLNQRSTHSDANTEAPGHIDKQRTAGDRTKDRCRSADSHGSSGSAQVRDRSVGPPYTKEEYDDFFRQHHTSIYHRACIKSDFAQVIKTKKTAKHRDGDSMDSVNSKDAPAVQSKEPECRRDGGGPGSSSSKYSPGPNNPDREGLSDLGPGWSYTALDFATNRPKFEHFVVAFETKNLAKDFGSVFDRCRQEAWDVSRAVVIPVDEPLTVTCSEREGDKPATVTCPWRQRDKSATVSCPGKHTTCLSGVPKVKVRVHHCHGDDCHHPCQNGKDCCNRNGCNMTMNEIPVCISTNGTKEDTIMLGTNGLGSVRCFDENESQNSLGTQEAWPDISADLGRNRNADTRAAGAGFTQSERPSREQASAALAKKSVTIARGENPFLAFISRSKEVSSGTQVLLEDKGRKTSDTLTEFERLCRVSDRVNGIDRCRAHRKDSSVFAKRGTSPKRGTHSAQGQLHPKEERSVWEKRVAFDFDNAERPAIRVDTEKGVAQNKRDSAQFESGQPCEARGIRSQNKELSLSMARPSSRDCPNKLQSVLHSWIKSKYGGRSRDEATDGGYRSTYNSVVRQQPERDYVWRGNRNLNATVTGLAQCEGGVCDVKGEISPRPQQWKQDSARTARQPHQLQPQPESCHQLPPSQAGQRPAPPPLISCIRKKQGLKEGHAQYLAGQSPCSDESLLHNSFRKRSDDQSVPSMASSYPPPKSAPSPRSAPPRRTCHTTGDDKQGNVNMNKTIDTESNNKESRNSSHLHSEATLSSCSSSSSFSTLRPSAEELSKMANHKQSASVTVDRSDRETGASEVIPMLDSSDSTADHMVPCGHGGGLALYNARADWGTDDQALVADTCSSLVRIVQRRDTDTARLLVTRKEDGLVVCDRRLDSSITLSLQPAQGAGRSVRLIMHARDSAGKRHQVALWLKFKSRKMAANFVSTVRDVRGATTGSEGTGAWKG